MERKQNRNLQLVTLGGFEKDGNLFWLEKGLFILHELGKTHLRDAQLFVVQRGGNERPAVQDGSSGRLLCFGVDSFLADGIGEICETEDGQGLEVVLPVGLIIQDRRGGCGRTLDEVDILIDQSAEGLPAGFCILRFFQHAELEFQRQIFDGIRIVAGECLADTADHDAAAVRADGRSSASGTLIFFIKVLLAQGPAPMIQ